MLFRSVSFRSVSYNIGGEQLLFARIAKQLIELGRAVNFIDYTNGFCYNFLAKTNYKHIPYDSQELPLSIKEPTVLLVPLSYIFIAAQQLKLVSQSTIIYWCIHPNNLLGLFHFTRLSSILGVSTSYRLIQLLFPRRLGHVKSVIAQAQAEGRVWFMDAHNYEHNEKFTNTAIAPVYMPIPVETSSEVAKKGLISTDSLHIAWLGRISKSDKYYALQLMCESILSVKNLNNRKIVFHIIGEGDALDWVRTFVASVERPDVEFKILGKMFGLELDHYLLYNIDVLFGMGTSVMESAKFGVPSVLLDVFQTRQNPDKQLFRWLFETKGFTLGSVDTHKKPLGTHTIASIAEAVLTSKDTVGQQCRNYVEQYHSLNVITKRVNKTIEQLDRSLVA
jgi:hypothetical protein